MKKSAFNLCLALVVLTLVPGIIFDLPLLIATAIVFALLLPSCDRSDDRKRRAHELKSCKYCEATLYGENPAFDEDVCLKNECMMLEFNLESKRESHY